MIDHPRTTRDGHTTTKSDHPPATPDGHTTTAADHPATTADHPKTTPAEHTTTPADRHTTSTSRTTTTKRPKPQKPPRGGGTLTGTVDLTYSKGQCSSGHSCFDCHQPVHLSLVRIRVDNSAMQKDAIGLNPGCTGSIARIDVDTRSADGVKIANNLNGDVSCSNGSDCAHDLTIGGGTVTSSGHNSSAHQDCMQAMGGRNITFSGVIFACQTANNAQFYVTINKQAAVATPPIDLVCNGCEFHPGTGYHSVTIGPSIRSGAVKSLVCPGTSPALQWLVLFGAQSVIDVNNTKPWPSDPRCW
jgi:hypothetical protein